ncbi:MAG: stage II sporulation protein M [Bacteroidales bacterium]|nr:stage II sporulation protein M [Bacteroidales bacterium]
MKESTFIRQNKEKWNKYAELARDIKHADGGTDEVVAAYREILRDLSFARSHCKNSRVVPYLNGLATAFHSRIYETHFSFRSVWKLFIHDAPAVVWINRKWLLASLVTFLAFTLFGVILAVIDRQYIIDMLGQGYVNQTLENIRNGVPTDIYNSHNTKTMFLGITFNNLWVTLKMYGYGLIPIVGPLYFISNNGLMLGEFQTLFFQEGVGLQSMSAIWIHGTLEISELIISGGAALLLGGGWLFPGSFSRMESLRRSAVRSIRILAVSIPLIFIAAFLESFVTRHVEWPLFVRLSIIILSAIYIGWYYVYLPIKIGLSEDINEFTDLTDLN